MEKHTPAKKPEVKPVPQPKKRVLVDETIERSQLLNSINAVLNSPHLNPSNRGYIAQMRDKLNARKHLTPNQIQGLSKIQRALQYVAKGTYRPSGEA
jgi:hypothetical protein